VSIRDQIAPLEDLATIDAELKRVEDELAQQRTMLEAMRSDVKGVEEQLAADRARLAEMERTRNELSIEARQMTQQIERSREKLGRSRTERESNAAQRELEELRKLQRDREDEIGKIGLLVESARKAIVDGEARLSSLTKSLEGTADGAARDIAALEAQQAEKAAARKTTAARLPMALYRRYESIRTRRPFAIAKTHDGTCLGCHVSVPPAMFQKMLRQEEFEQCPNCRRILYYMRPPAKDGDGAELSSR
jgi:predicted  nucleic acid-binding Zn-ribbon protein